MQWKLIIHLSYVRACMHVCACTARSRKVELGEQHFTGEAPLAEVICEDKVSGWAEGKLRYEL